MRLILILLITSLSFSQNIWRVDNNTSNVADFTSLANALASASVVNGDIIYIAGSVISYGSATFTKSVKVYGPGYFLGQNPNTQANLSTAYHDYLYLNAGSVGSEIHGLNIYQVLINTDNILISNNYLRLTTNCINIDGTTIDPIANVVISQNYMLGYVELYEFVSNVIISNNYIEYVRLSYANSTSTVSNNIIWGDWSTNANLLTNSLVQNNIILSTNSIASLEAGNNTANNNITYGTGLDTGSGNVNSAVSGDIFVVSGTTDGKWKLKSGSIAEGVGVAGEDLGMFGGSSPYVLSGIPSIPSIYNVTIPIFGTSAGLNVNIKAKSNN